MKTCTLLFVIPIAVSANAQDKPRVFVQGKGSENVSSNGAAGGDHHWAESMEVGENFQKDCSDVIVTIKQANADYIVMMNRESKQPSDCAEQKIPGRDVSGWGIAAAKEDRCQLPPCHN